MLRLAELGNGVAINLRGLSDPALRELRRRLLEGLEELQMESRRSARVLDLIQAEIEDRLGDRERDRPDV